MSLSLVVYLFINVKKILHFEKIKVFVRKSRYNNYKTVVMMDLCIGDILGFIRIRCYGIYN